MTQAGPSDPAAAPGPLRNRHDRMEWAGAFGDLGTLIPFLAAYIGVVKMDPCGLLFAFGLAMIASGLYYRTPVPVQPMKAVGAVAAVQAAQGAISPGAVHAAAIVTGLAWLMLGATRWMARVLRLVPRAVVAGVVLGLGAGFMLQGAQMMRGGWWAAAFALALGVALRRSRVLPAMFALLLFGIALGAWGQPQLLRQIAAVPLALHWPALTLGDLRWSDVATGAVLLALPQFPLTLGNAILAVREENNRLFPQRPVAERELAASTGVMNLLAGCIGGVPMCHGAGGMAAHVAFGARTGGAVVILGGLLLALGLFFSDGVQLLFQLFSQPVLGVILLLAGWQLARGARWPAQRKAQWVMVVCAVVSVWNVAVGFVVGVLLHALVRE